MTKSVVCFGLVILISLPGTFIDGAQAQEISDIKSPRLRALAAQIDSGNSEALEEFWKTMEAATTPLIEAIEDDPTHVWLTVLWRGDKDTENVLLVGGLVRGHPLDNTLEQLFETDLWYRTYWTRNDLRATYQFSPNDPLVSVPMDDQDAVAAQRKNYRNDPLNPIRRGWSLIELPDAPEQTWIQQNRDAPKGTIQTENAFNSDVLGNERRLSVYLPPDYDPSAAPYPMFLVFDRAAYITLVPTPRILNNLIHSKKIPPVVAVLIGNAVGARNDELTCNDDFVEFLSDELIPWVRENYNVSTEPAKNVIGGSSFGGLAASFVAYRHPELFGNVISQSGSYWWSPETNSNFLAHEVEGEWLTRQYAEADTKAIRFVLEVGLNEGGRPSTVIVNRHFRNVLLAKGYEIVKYDEYNGGHEYLNWRGSLGDGLIALIGKWAK